MYPLHTPSCRIQLGVDYITGCGYHLKSVNLRHTLPLAGAWQVAKFYTVILSSHLNSNWGYSIPDLILLESYQLNCYDICMTSRLSRCPLHVVSEPIFVPEDTPVELTASLPRICIQIVPERGAAFQPRTLQDFSPPFLHHFPSCFVLSAAFCV